jgi:hypothetical protein
VALYPKTESVAKQIFLKNFANPAESLSLSKGFVVIFSPQFLSDDLSVGLSAVALAKAEALAKTEVSTKADYWGLSLYLVPES